MYKAHNDGGRNNIKVYSEENILFGGMGWIELAQYRAQ
jgi:hypothetical protein